MNQVLKASQGLDKADVQGDILRAYGNTYICTSYLFVHVGDPALGRAWLRSLVDVVTNAEDWPGAAKPETTLNVAVTCAGLAGLGVPEKLIGSFSHEFREGMGARAELLGDVGESAPAGWDQGLAPGAGHVLLIVNAQSDELLRRRIVDLKDGIAAAGSLEVVHEEHARVLDGAREHFGYADGFAQPAVEGVTADKARGGGVPGKAGTWRPLALGEFILGYEDEASRDDPSRALPHAPDDPIGRNGTYMVWRKLEQDVALFRRILRDAAALYQGGDEEKLAAKVVGRWRNGTPLVLSPDTAMPNFDSTAPGANDFRYTEPDFDGHRCPLGAHIRRSNPRDALGFDGEGTLTFRHRMIRRGMPYGPLLPPGLTEPDGQERGLVFVCFVASISRQFEGVQVQWLEDGNIFHLGHDKDFLLRAGTTGTPKMTVQGEPPFFLSPQPSFVTLRGGEYLFVPGIAALRILAAS